jgi:cytochrome c553
VQIDIARLNDAKLNGEYYQQSNRLHENLRLATLIRDNFTCQCCKAKKTSLEAHHIHYRKDGGKETINNLITVCSTCHSRIHDGTVTLKKKGVDGFKDQIAQRTMQGKIYLYSELNKKYKVTKVYGYEY